MKIADKPMMSLRTWAIFTVLSCLSLLAVMVIETYTDLDIWFQNLWYIPETKSWWLSIHEFQETRWLWYGGAKKMVSIFGGICVAGFIGSFYLKKLRIWRKSFLLICLSLLFVPLIVATGKKVTDIYCPNGVTLYNGIYEHQRILEPRNPINDLRGDGRHGQCFPGGHCSGGFALIVLFFAVPYPRLRVLGLLIGLSAGFLMGTYQVVRGEHFMSHTFATMSIAFIFNLLCIYLIEKFAKHLKLENEVPKIIDL